jgi:guanylate kinase
LGLIEFKKHFNDNIISFFIDVDEPTRRNRCINRNDFNETEWNRRCVDDIKQFSRELIEKEVDYIVENYNFDECINKIKEILNG